MCGIAGFAGFGSEADLRAMTEALAHRGPDGAGFWSGDEPPVFLGHRRLAIIDIGGGRQPMWDAAGRIGVVFNGEIYNHIELRRELEDRGHRFATDHSDTEVLIHGYREWGKDFFHGSMACWLTPSTTAIGLVFCWRVTGSVKSRCIIGAGRAAWPLPASCPPWRFIRGSIR